MKLYIKFNEEGYVSNMFTINKVDINGKKPPKYDIALTDYPKDLKANLDYYIKDVDSEDNIVGVKLREDLEAYKAAQEAERIRLEEENNNSFPI